MKAQASIKTSDVEHAKYLLDELRMVYEHIVSYHQTLDRRIGADQISESEGTDLGFLHREVEQLADELRKECKARKDVIGRVLAVKITRRCIENPSEPISSRGELATASPDTKMRPMLPKHGTPEFTELMRFFGVNTDATEHGLLTPSWVRLSEWLTARSESGLPTPPGLLGLVPEPQVVFRKRKRDE